MAFESLFEVENILENNVLFIGLSVAIVAIVCGYYGYKFIKREDKSLEITKSEKIAVVLLFMFIIIFTILLYYMPVLV